MYGSYILASKRSGTLYPGLARDLPRRLTIFTVYEARQGTAPSHPHRGARHRDEAIKQAAAGGLDLNRPQTIARWKLCCRDFPKPARPC